MEPNEAIVMDIVIIRNVETVKYKKSLEKNAKNPLIKVRMVPFVMLVKLFQIQVLILNQILIPIQNQPQILDVLQSIQNCENVKNVLITYELFVMNLVEMDSLMKEKNVMMESLMERNLVRVLLYVKLVNVEMDILQKERTVEDVLKILENVQMDVEMGKRI